MYETKWNGARETKQKPKSKSNNNPNKSFKISKEKL